MTLPLDQDVRNASTGALGQTLFIEAGAGTGKTTMLVERVANLITTRAARMDEIAAITFSEAAAAELRDRLAQRFEELAVIDPESPAAEALDALDAAAVTTLHGFARALLSEQPFSVGLPPLFEVADASSSRVAFDERWDRVVSSFLEDLRYRDLAVRALSRGINWEQLKAVALQCEENWDRLGPIPGVGSPPPVDASRVVELLEMAASLSVECVDPADRLAVHLSDRVRSSLEAISRATGDIDLLQVLVGLPKLSAGNAGNRDNWSRAADGSSRKAEVLALLEEAWKERNEVIGETDQWVLAGLLGLIVTFTLEAVEERRRAGRLSFHDLLVWARELVRGDPVARAELHDRYTHILIDEFQDTDPIQAELAMRLANGALADNGPGADWVEFGAPPGSLFFVGDPKQSIYRFRRADIDVFMTVRDHVVGSALQLTTNFRSRPQILAWCNAVFGTMFGPGVPHQQPAYEPLHAHDDHGHDNHRGLTPVIVLGIDQVDGNADEVREVQARDVAATITTMHADRWPIGTDGTPMRYSDVAVLIPARTGLPILEDALRTAGVPYRLESSSLVYESQEVRQLVSILRAIDDPTDAVSVLAALRSPAFGCGDDDLYRYHEAGGGWDYRNTARGDGPVTGGLADLHDLHDGRWWHSVSALVAHVVTERRLLQLSLADERPRESWRRIRFLIDQARLFDESSGGDLRAFLGWVGHQQEEGARVTEVIVPESDDDAVRISTVHAAKGLEFPVTVVMGIQAPQSSQRPAMLFHADGYELCVKKGIETPGYDAALQFEREMALHEQRRLLYVAATRASDVLIVSTHRDRSGKQSLASEVAALCEQNPALWSDGSDLCGPPAGAEAPVVTPVADLPMQEERAAFILRRTEQLTRAAVPVTIAATAVESLRKGQATDVGDEPPVEESLEREVSGVRRRGRAGTSVGRAVHAVLQLVDLASGNDLDSLSRAQAAAEGIGERTGEVTALVRSALASDLVRQAVAGGRFWREVYVGVPVGDRVLEGFIDLLMETDEGLVIVDYKTDRLAGDESADSVARRYRTQGASYALAASLSLGRTVAGCSFLVLSPHGAIEASLPDLETAMAEVGYLLGLPVP